MNRQVAGQLVKQFNHLMPQASTHAQSGGAIQPFNQIVWNGKDNEGKILPEGIYFCELNVDSQRLTKKLILLR